jgi:AcrR family transcriptional regulator
VARPRKISDEDLLAACGRAIGRHGPGFTLAQAAAEAGVAVGTVAGRFGSKQNLLLAMMAAGGAAVAPRMRAAAAGHDDPVTAIIAATLVTTEGVDDPSTTQNHLAQLGVDLADPTLRSGLASLRAAVHEVLTELCTAAALPGAPPPAQAARVIATLAHGALLDWALNPTGRVTDLLGSDLTAVLDGWRRGSPAQRTRPAAQLR